MYANEVFPQMHAICGISWEDFWKMNPMIIEQYKKGYQNRRKIHDEEMWLMGQYNHEAFSVVLSHAISGIFGKTSKTEYPKQPFLQKLSESTTKNTNKESHEEVGVFEMKQRINLLRKAGLPESPA
jgi:hypothetical protein